MGNISPYLTSKVSSNGGSRRGKKRKYESESEEKERLEEENLHTPKRKKLKSTSRYIYETLFEKGENSDITIVALGKDWPLHKVYLCQCSYFSSMFSGSWKESSFSVINMNIPDENIDEEALKIAFGTLYKDDFIIEPARVVSVLAAAILLGLDGLIQQCSDVMQETISAKTVCGYHTASLMYGEEVLTKKCFDWLEKNLMSVHSVPLLKDLSIELMTKLISSPNLFVMQVEMDAYTLIKKWIFLKSELSWDGLYKDLSAEIDTFYKKRVTLTDTITESEEDPVDFFLESVEGAMYTPVFRGLRLRYILCDLFSAKQIEDDKIIPNSWLLPLYKQMWIQMVRIEQDHDSGPQQAAASNFLLVASRCGRVLSQEGNYCWRWTGYDYGIDLLMSFKQRSLSLKRNTLDQSCLSAVSLRPTRHVIVRVTVASLNSLGQPKYIKTTGVKCVSLEKDENSPLFNLERHVKFPVHISCNFLVYTPVEQNSETASPQNIGQSEESRSSSAALDL